MDGSAFQLIPTDVIKAWAKGDYYIGDIPSISYRHLGIALLLRGWYTYVDTTEDGKQKEWAGVAKVDIKGSVLSMGGIRLFDEHTIFWRTEHSYIQNDKEIVWFYSGFNCDVPEPFSAIRDKYIKHNWSINRDLPGKQFGMDSDNWKNLLAKLATDFDSDVERIAQARSGGDAKPGTERRKNLQKDLGMLRFNVDLDPNEDEPVRKCEYYHFDSQKQIATAGVSTFRKVTNCL